MTTDTKAPKFKCEVCQDTERVPDPLNEGEEIRCLECDFYDAEKTRRQEAEPTKEEWLHNARSTLRSANAMTCGFGVIVPLPMAAEDVMRTTDAARALGFGLVSHRIADRVEPLFGPVLAVTTEGLEGPWLDFLRAREKSKP